MVQLTLPRKTANKKPLLFEISLFSHNLSTNQPFNLSTHQPLNLSTNQQTIQQTAIHRTLFFYYIYHEPSNFNRHV